MQVRMNLNSLVARKIVAISFQPLNSYKQECLSTHNTYIWAMCIYIYIYAIYESVCCACVYVFVYACICVYHMNART